MLTPWFLLIAAIPVVVLTAGLVLRLVLPQTTARLLGLIVNLAGTGGAVLLLSLGFQQMGATELTHGDGFGGFLYTGSGFGLVVLSTLLGRVLRS